MPGKRQTLGHRRDSPAANIRLTNSAGDITICLPEKDQNENVTERGEDKWDDVDTRLLRPPNSFKGRRPVSSVIDDSNNSLIFRAIWSALEEDEKTETEACETLSVILELPTCTTEDLNAYNKTESADWYSCPATPLQMAAEGGLSQIVQMLVSDERVDILLKDEHNRNALHYAASQEAYHNYDGGLASLSALIEKTKHNTPLHDRDQTLTQCMFHDKDNQGNSPFAYICETYPSGYVCQLMELLPAAEKWGSDVPLMMLYTKCPMALLPIMDSSFSYHKDRNWKPKTYIDVDFGIITGYRKATANVGKEKESEHIMNTVWHSSKVQKKVLLHPLVQLYVKSKWSRFTAVTYMLLVMQILWVAAFTVLLFRFYPTNRPKVNWNFELPWMYHVAVCAILILCSGVISLSAVEIVEATNLKWNYWKYARNWFQLMQIISAICILYPIWPGGRMAWNKYVGVTGLFLSYFLLLGDIGRAFAEVGILVEVLRRVLRKTVLVLVGCSPLWGAFCIVFLLLFDEDYMYYGGQHLSPLVRVVAMMTGDYDYNEAFKPASNLTKSATFALKYNSNWKMEIRLLMFVVFIVVIPIAFFNLLTGYALEEIGKFKGKAVVTHTAKRLDNIAFMETFLSPFLVVLNLLGLKDLVTYTNLVKDPITGKIVASKLVMKFIKSRDHNEVLGKRPFQQGGGHFWNCILDRDLYSKILKLADANKHGSKESTTRLRCISMASNVSQAGLDNEEQPVVF